MTMDVRPDADTVYRDDSPAAGWLARLVRLPPRVPALATLALVGVLGLLERLLPPPAGRVLDEGNLRLQLFFLAMIALLAVTVPAAVRRAVASTQAITDIEASDRAAFRDALVTLPLPWIVIPVGIGVAVHVSILRAVGIDFASHLDPNIMLTSFGVARASGWLFIVSFAIATSILLRHAVLFRRLGANLQRIDLLDHRALAPFVRASFRTTWIYVSWAACTAAFHVRWERDLSIEPQALASMPVSALLTSIAFLLPIWGVHQRLRAEREAELERVHAAIRGDRKALRDSLLAEHAEALSPIDLLVYREHVCSLSTWPFGASALARVALLTAVPVLGWLGGALVERALDLFLE